MNKIHTLFYNDPLQDGLPMYVCIFELAPYFHIYQPKFVYSSIHYATLLAYNILLDLKIVMKFHKLQVFRRVC